MPESGPAGVVEDLLPGGPAATTVHEGPYDTAGAPWESYITDPAEYPDPKDWKTEVC